MHMFLIIYDHFNFTSKSVFNDYAPTGGEVVREAVCYTKGPGYEFRVRHVCQNCPSQAPPVAALKT